MPKRRYRRIKWASHKLNRWQGGVVDQARTLANPRAFYKMLGETLFAYLKEVRKNPMYGAGLPLKYTISGPHLQPFCNIFLRLFLYN